MANTKKTIVHDIAQIEILSLKDGAYKQAQATDTGRYGITQKLNRSCHSPWRFSCQ